MIETITPAFSLFGILDSLNPFLVAFIGAGAVAGAFSRKLSIMGYGAFLVFIHVVQNTDLFIFDALLYVVLAVVILYASRSLISGYFESESGAT